MASLTDRINKLVHAREPAFPKEQNCRKAENAWRRKDDTWTDAAEKLTMKKQTRQNSSQQVVRRSIDKTTDRLQSPEDLGADMNNLGKVSIKEDAKVNNQNTRHDSTAWEAADPEQNADGGPQRLPPARPRKRHEVYELNTHSDTLGDMEMVDPAEGVRPHGLTRRIFQPVSKDRTCI